MDYSVRRQLAEPVHHLHDQRQSFGLLEAILMLHHEGLEGAAIGQLLDDIDVIGSLMHFQELDDVGRLQILHDFDLSHHRVFAVLIALFEYWVNVELRRFLQMTLMAAMNPVVCSLAL